MRLPNRSILLIALAMCTSASCVLTRDHAPDSAVLADAAAVPTDAATTDTLASSHAPAKRLVPTVEVQSFSGIDQDTAMRWLASVDGALAECHPTRSGVVRVTVDRTESETIVRAVGPSVFEAQTMECVMSALSMLDVESADPLFAEPPPSTGESSPSDDPRTVSTQASLSW